MINPELRDCPLQTWFREERGLFICYRPHENHNRSWAAGVGTSYGQGCIHTVTGEWITPMVWSSVNLFHSTKDQDVQRTFVTDHLGRSARMDLSGLALAEEQP